MLIASFSSKVYSSLRLRAQENKKERKENKNEQ